MTTLFVSTHRECLLSILVSRADRPYRINGDQARQWEAEHSRKQARLRQDRKSGRARRRVREDMNRLSDKANRRKQSLVHEVSAKVIQLAKRRNVSVVQFDGTVKSFVRSFPWHDLATKIAYKCEDAGIAFVDVTQAVKEPDAEKPHVYFALGTITGHVKIGKTAKSFRDRLSDGKTFASEPVVLLAVDNQPKSKLTQRETYWHSMFADHRMTRVLMTKDMGGEWFSGKPVIQWLREAKWLGNAGNLSQIAQHLDVSQDTGQSEPPTGSPRGLVGNDPASVSQKAVKSPRYSHPDATASEATEQIV